MAALLALFALGAGRKGRLLLAGAAVLLLASADRSRGRRAGGLLDVGAKDVTLTAEGRYAAFVALLGELSRLPRLQAVESVSLVRQPSGVAWTLTLRAAHW